MKREIQEETNFEVIRFLPIGYQKVIRSDKSYIYQLRSCCIVKSLGEFTHDPAGSISEIRFVNPKDYKQYFDWGEIGERIIQRGQSVFTNIIKK